MPTSNDTEEEDFENTVGKGENAGNQHFLLFSQCFLPWNHHLSKILFVICIYFYLWTSRKQQLLEEELKLNGIFDQLQVLIY